jgi:hypothetical protein
MIGKVLLDVFIDFKYILNWVEWQRRTKFIQDELLIDLNPSKYMGIGLIMQHLGGFLCVVYAPLYNYPFISILLGLGILWHLMFCVKKYVYCQDPESIVHFSLKPSGKGVFHLKKGMAIRGAVLHTSSYLSRYCIVLAVRSVAARTRYMVIFKDSITPFAYQRLLAHIRAIPKIRF